MRELVRERWQPLGGMRVYTGMRAVLMVVATAACAALAQEDERVRWLAEHAVPLRTIAIHENDMSDLAPLKAAIGGARVVLLGEQTHGDGATFAAKSRLVKFLHREMGFEVLAWESGMEEMRRLDEAFAAGRSVEEAPGIGLFGIWSISQQCQELLGYVRKERVGERPLLTAGFDDQVTTAPSSTPFPKKVNGFFDAVDAGMLTAEQRESLGRVFAWLEQRPGPDRPALPGELGAVRSLLDVVERERERLEAVHGRREVRFQERAIGNVVSFVERMKPGVDAFNDRDRRMGENLLFLANEYYKGKKVIVWAASMHNARRVEGLEWVGSANNHRGVRPMGDVLFETMGDGMYSVMFTAYSGRIGRPWSGAAPIEKAAEGTLEAMLHATGKPYLFVDFRGLPEGHWLRGPVVARPLGYAPMRGAWPESFDAVVFTDRMYPSTAVGAEPEDARPR